MSTATLYEASGGVWQRYGLRADPYFIQPLTKETFGLFAGAGRMEAAEGLALHVRSGGSPILLLEGPPGVGKTTLVNYALNTIRGERQHFVYPQRIELSAASTRESLASEYLSAMTTAALAAEPDLEWLSDPRWREAHDTIADTWKASGLGGGLTFAGFGGNLTRTQFRQLAKVMPWETWKSLAQNILNAMRERRAGFVVHLNNLDAVSDDHPETIRRVFDEARELLIMEGMHTVLCGGANLRNDVLADRQRILDVITGLPPLNPLTPQEFLEAINARYAHYRTEEHFSVTPPLSPDALTTLYELFEGDIRNTFQVAKAAVVQAALTDVHANSLGLTEALLLNASSLEQQFTQLPDGEQAIVEHLLEHGESPSQTALRQASKIAQPTVSHATRRLEAKRWITTLRSGRQLAYRLTGYGLLLRKARMLGSE